MDYTSKTLDGNCQQLTMYTNKCYNEYVPFTDSDYTYLKITNPHHDVNLINQNFIDLQVKLNITPKKDLEFLSKIYKDYYLEDEINEYIETGREETILEQTVSRDIGKKLYIGWKNSSEIIEEMTVYNNGRETGFQQVHADRENYLEATRYMTATEKDKYRQAHFTYNNYYHTKHDDVPGYICENTELGPATTISYDNNDITYVFKGSLENENIIPISDEFKEIWIRKYPQMIIGQPTRFDFADFKEVVYKCATGEEHYAEWADFLFCYDYEGSAENGYDTVDINGDGQHHTSFNDLSTWMQTEEHKYDKIVTRDNEDGIRTYHFVKTITTCWKNGIWAECTINMIIPLKDLPAFNSMDYFERPFGDIVLKLMLGPRSLMIFTENEKCRQYPSSDFELQAFEITRLNCLCYGYNISNELGNEIWAPLRSKYGNDSDKSRIYEARFTNFKNFEGNVEGGKLDIQFPGALEMVKSIHMAFPRNTNDMTVFRNPQLRDVKLKLDGILYPREENIRTDNRLFTYWQLKNFDADDDFKYSIQCPFLDNINNVALPDEDKDPKLDDSNFIMTYDLAVGHFMAYHKYSDNVNIHFTAEIIYKAYNLYGVSYWPNPLEYTDTEPSPQIWFTHDACWRLNLRDGLTFMYKTCPSFDLYNNDKEDIFYMKQGN